jgi:myo-inositol-1(or 4)-monophosphatase
LGLLYQGVPVFGYVQMPPLNQGFHGFYPGSTGLSWPRSAFCNDRPLHSSGDKLTSSHLFSFCTRSIQMLQQETVRNRPFPCKIRMLGVATYNLLGVATGAVLGGLEATPKVWDIAATWVIVQAAGGEWMALRASPFPLEVGQNYRDLSYPTFVTARSDLVQIFEPWARELTEQTEVASPLDA